MEYFVNSEQKAYDDWQLELLIESFKHHEIDEFLTIAGANVNQDRYDKLYNLIAHKNYFPYQSIGQKRGFTKLDELYSLAWCIQNQKLGQRICLIQPSVVIKNKSYTLNIPDKETFAVAIDPFFTFDHAEKMAGNFWENQNNSKDFYKNNWLPVGNVIFLNKISYEFVSRTIILAENLIVNQIINKIPVWEDTIKLAWALNTIDHIGRINIFASYEYTSSMSDASNAPFIDYHAGLPPTFNKSMFTFKPPINIAFGDPIEVLANCRSSPNAAYMAEIANSLLRTRSSSSQ